MEENFKFNQVKSCKYFPCHDVKNIDEFNCKFCYCPLYFTDCKGNFEILESGFKNCTNCLIPHRPNNYEYINNEIKKEVLKKKQAKEAKDKDKGNKCT